LLFHISDENCGNQSKKIVKRERRTVSLHGASKAV